MKLPNGDRADLGNKIKEYILNVSHRIGQHKARLFGSVLGISLSNAHLLKDALATAARTLDTAVPRGDFGHGMEYKLAFPLSTRKGTAAVVSGWIVRHGEDFPRLTTCYILQTNER